MKMKNELTTKEKAEETNILVGKRIRLFRQQRGLSQEQVGEHLGVTFQQLQKYERGINRTSAGILQNLADLYKVTVADFFAPAKEGGLESFSKVQFQTIRTLHEIKNEDSIKHLRRTIKFLVELEGK